MVDSIRSRRVRAEGKRRRSGGIAAGGHGTPRATPVSRNTKPDEARAGRIPHRAAPGNAHLDAGASAHAAGGPGLQAGALGAQPSGSHMFLRRRLLLRGRRLPLLAAGAKAPSPSCADSRSDARIREAHALASSSRAIARAGCAGGFQLAHAKLREVLAHPRNAIPGRDVHLAYLGDRLCALTARTPR